MKKKKTAAFTLVEFLVYSALITIIVGMIVLVSVNVMGARARIITRGEVNHNARFALERMGYEIRRAESITSPSSGSSTSLTLVDGDGFTRVFGLSEGVLQMTIGGDTPIALTNDLVSATDLQVFNLSYPSTPGTVRIETTIEFLNPLGRPEWEFEETFYTTENIRG